MDGIRDLFAGLRISSTGLSAERTRIDVIARNIANAETTRMPDGSGPYRRQVVHFEPILRRLESGRSAVQGVQVSRVAEDRATPLEQVHDPGHPDADPSGMVLLPNVNAVREMADLITAMRAYEANLAAQDGFVQLAERALRLAQ